MNFAAVRNMYVFEFKSTNQIARELGVATLTINRALRAMGVELRTKTSLRFCRIPGCGRETFKRLCSNGKGVVLSGGLCREHTLAHWREKNRRRAA